MQNTFIRTFSGSPGLIFQFLFFTVMGWKINQGKGQVLSPVLGLSQADKDREQVALDNLVEEIADVEIMLEQVKDLLQIPEEDIQAIKLYKVNRTSERIVSK